MNNKQTKAVILNDLPSLHINFLTQTIDLRWVGKSTKVLNLVNTNPVTGEKEVQATISITANIDTGTDNFLLLQYEHNGKIKNQRIDLIAKGSVNIQNGTWYFFKCPATGLSCKKLFLYGYEFVSRKAIPNAHTYNQTMSRKQRNAMKDIKHLLKNQKILKEAEKKYFMKFYNGNPTGKYIRVRMAEDDLAASW